MTCFAALASKSCPHCRSVDLESVRIGRLMTPALQHEIGQNQNQKRQTSQLYHCLTTEQPTVVQCAWVQRSASQRSARRVWSRVVPHVNGIVVITMMTSFPKWSRRWCIAFATRSDCFALLNRLTHILRRFTF